MFNRFSSIFTRIMGNKLTHQHRPKSQSCPSLFGHNLPRRNACKASVPAAARGCKASTSALPGGGITMFRRESEVALLQRRIHDKANNIRGSMYQRRLLRRPSDFTDLQHLKSHSQGVQLSERDVQLIRAAVPPSYELRKNLKIIYDTLLRRLPELRNQLATYATSEDRSMENIIKLHVNKTVEVLELVCNGLDALEDTLGSYLTAVGAQHADFHFQIQPHYWDMFAELLCEDACQNWKITRDRLDTLCAWRIVVFFLVTKIRIGYDELCSYMPLRSATPTP